MTTPSQTETALYKAIRDRVLTEAIGHIQKTSDRYFKSIERARKEEPGNNRFIEDMISVRTGLDLARGSLIRLRMNKLLEGEK